MNHFPENKLVVNLTDAVSQRLGRPAHCRKVRNQEEWYIGDPVFSFITRGKHGKLGYRVGYRVNLDSQQIVFTLVHNPSMAFLFKRNLVFSTLVNVIQATAKYRKNHWILFSSKAGYASGYRVISEEDKILSHFVIALEDFDRDVNFVKDLFPKVGSTGKVGGTAKIAGNTFYLNLADRFGSLKTRASVFELIDLSWPLFLCLYPIKPIEGRNAGLARSMKNAGLPKLCEFNSIKVPSNSEISPLCRGPIQGAHIKPDSRGGSDRPGNGLWLCEYHHRSTEGKISGSRNGSDINVTFVQDTTK